MQRKKILFVVNPISGGLNKRKLPELIAKNLNRELFAPELFYTSLKLNAREITLKAIEEKFDIIIAAGGDGTMNQVAQCLINSDIIMGILPLGSGNGLARHLQIPLQIKKAIAFINRLNTVKIDTIKVNDQYSVNCIGIGFDAFIAYHFSKLPHRGLKTYITTTIKHFKNYHRQYYKIKIDTEIFEDKAAIVTFANSTQWGNNFHIASTADITDGKIDVTIIKHLNYRNILQLAYRLISKTIHKSKQAITLKAEEIEIQLDENTPMHIDGEPMLTKGLVKIQIEPHSLNILCDL